MRSPAPGVSKERLTQTLRELEGDGLIERRVFRVVPPMVEYSLSKLGSRFIEPLLNLYEWAEAHGDFFDQIEGNRRVGARVVRDQGLKISASAAESLTSSLTATAFEHLARGPFGKVVIKIANA